MRVVCAQSWPTLCDPTDCSPPGSSVHGILQARILERVAVPFSMGSSQPRDQTRFPYIGRWILYRVTTISCLCPYVPSLVSPPPHIPPPRSSQTTRLSSPCHTAASHELFYTWSCMCVNPDLPIRPTLPFHHRPFVVSTRPSSGVAIEAEVKKRKLSYINSDVWNLEKWYRWAHNIFNPYSTHIPTEIWRERGSWFPNSKEMRVWLKRHVVIAESLCCTPEEKRKHCWSTRHQSKLIFKLVHNTIKEETEGKIVPLIGLATV